MPHNIAGYVILLCDTSNILHVDYPLENDNDNDNAGFDRESTSRQSFSEKRKQASSMSPPPLPREYRSLNRKKNGNFIEMTI